MKQRWFKAERDRALQDNAPLREEMHITDVRMARIPPHQRPLYQPTERTAILQLKAARGWSLEQTAKAFTACWYSDASRNTDDLM